MAVIELNLGFKAELSCDGHDRNYSAIGFNTSHVAMYIAIFSQNIGIVMTYKRSVFKSPYLLL